MRFLIAILILLFSVTAQAQIIPDPRTAASDLVTIGQACEDITFDSTLQDRFICTDDQQSKIRVITFAKVTEQQIEAADIATFMGDDYNPFYVLEIEMNAFAPHDNTSNAGSGDCIYIASNVNNTSTCPPVNLPAIWRACRSDDDEDWVLDQWAALPASSDCPSDGYTHIFTYQGIIVPEPGRVYMQGKNKKAGSPYISQDGGDAGIWEIDIDWEANTASFGEDNSNLDKPAHIPLRYATPTFRGEYVHKTGVFWQIGGITTTAWLEAWSWHGRALLHPRWQLGTPGYGWDTDATRPLLSWRSVLYVPASQDLWFGSQSQDDLFFSDETSCGGLGSCTATTDP